MLYPYMWAVRVPLTHTRLQHRSLIRIRYLPLWIRVHLIFGNLNQPEIRKTKRTPAKMHHLIATTTVH
jgi:hypothetical protein